MFSNNISLLTQTPCQFLLDGLLSALPDPAGTEALSSSSECSYYSCDNSSDYVGSASNG